MITYQMYNLINGDHLDAHVKQYYTTKFIIMNIHYNKSIESFCKKLGLQNEELKVKQ